LTQQFLDQQIRSHVEQERVAASQLHVAQRVGEFDDSLLVSASVDEDAPFVQHLFDGDTSPWPSDSRTPMTVKDSFSTTSLPRSIWPGRGPGGAPRASCARRRICHGASSLKSMKVRRPGWLRELFDLVTKGRDLITRLLNRDGELLVVGSALGEGAASLEQFLLEHLDASAGLFDVTHGRVARRTHDDLVVVLRNVVTAKGVERSITSP